MTGEEDVLAQYEEVREKLLGDVQDFSDIKVPDALVRSFAICTFNLRTIKELIETDRVYADHVEDHHRFQHALVHRAVNSFRSTYILLCHNCYNACYRELRHQYETYLTLKGLNADDPDRVARKFNEFRIQAGSVVGGKDERTHFGYEYIGYLRSRRDSGKDKLENKYRSFREIYGYLSERAVHPYRIDGLYLDGEYVENQMGENVYLSFFLLFGVLKEYEIALRDTPISDMLSEEFELIEKEALSVFPQQEFPAFLMDYL